MKNSKLRRVLLLLASAVLLVSLSVGATLAYLTSTDEVKNTFTVGQVKILLDEADVYELGDDGATRENLGKNKTDAPRVDKNSYKFMPGHDLDKDPKVTVQAGSEDCYVRVMVTVTRFADLKLAMGITDDDDAAAKLATYITGYNDAQFDDNGWTYGADSVTYEFRVTGIVLASTSDQYFTLFTGIEVPDDMTNEQLEYLKSAEGEEDMTITAVAHAIQADGFADADAAWAAFEE